MLTRAAALPEVVARYDARPDALIELHLPPGDGPWSLVVLLHGGFWKQAYDRRHLRPMARALVAADCAVALPEYRRVGGGGGWPTTLHDVAVAVAALPGVLHGLGLSTTTTTLVGHSAGGQLALWLTAGARRDAGPRPPRIDRVVGLSPVTDLYAAAAAGLGDRATEALLGGDPGEVPERYAAADPMSLLAEGPVPADLVVVHGTDDDDVPVEQSRALAAAHPEVRLHELAGVGHYGLIDPLSGAWPVVLNGLTGGLPGQ